MGGASRPFLVQARAADSTAAQWVMKLRSPDGGVHRGATSLACEMIFFSIARDMGIPVPDAAIIEVDGAIAETVDPDADRTLLLNNLGPNFGSRSIEGAIAWPTNARLTQLDIDLLAWIMAFDLATLNGDRTDISPNILRAGPFGVVLIDHSWVPSAGPVTLEEHVDLDGIGVGDWYPRAHATFQSLKSRGAEWGAFKRAWRGAVTEATLAELWDRLPPEWWASPQDADHLYAFLLERHRMLDAIDSMLRRVSL